MAWPRYPSLAFEAYEVDPAQLAGDRAAESRAHPRSDEPSRPQLAVRRWSLQDGQQLRLLLLRQRQRLPPRMGLPPVVQALGAQRVVALDHLPDPAASKAGATRDLRGGLPLAHQPHDLPPRPLDCLLGRSIAALHVMRIQMRDQHKMSSHAAIVEYPARLGIRRRRVVAPR